MSTKYVFLIIPGKFPVGNMRIIDLDCLAKALNDEDVKHRLRGLVPGEVVNVKLLTYELTEDDPAGVEIPEDGEYGVYEVVVQIEYFGLSGTLSTMEFSLRKVLKYLDDETLSFLLVEGCLELL